MFCKATTEELKAVSVGKSAFEKMSPRKINEHNANLDAVIARAIEREPDKFKEGAFLFQYK